MIQMVMFLNHSSLVCLKGWITNKTALPVTKLNFGRTKSSMSSGEHRLGLLECSGLETSSPVPSSCEDLKIHGHMLSGIYTVKTEEGLRNVFCNMAKLPGDQGILNFTVLITNNRNDMQMDNEHDNICSRSFGNCGGC